MTWSFVVVSEQKKHLRMLREAVYSAGFVDIMEKMTGLALSRKFDMSGHRYSDKVNHLEGIPIWRWRCHDG